MIFTIYIYIYTYIDRERVWLNIGVIRPHMEGQPGLRYHRIRDWWEGGRQLESFHQIRWTKLMGGKLCRTCAVLDRMVLCKGFDDWRPWGGPNYI